MPLLKSSARLCCQMSMIVCHAWHRSTVCSFQQIFSNATPNVIQPCLLSKGYVDLPRIKWSYSLWCPRTMMECHTRCRPTMCLMKWQWLNNTPNFIWQYLLSKVDDDIKRSRSYNRVCCPRAFIECHTGDRPTVCAFQMKWWHATPDIIRLCV